MKRTDLEKIIEKAKVKKDGVYSYNGIAYSVKDNRVWLLTDGYSCWQFSFGFLASLGSLPPHKNRKKYLQNIMKGVNQ